MIKSSILTLIFLSVFGCNQKIISTTPNKIVSEEHIVTPAPKWTEGANLYEVNIRQFTPEGTFEAFRAHLPRLKELGVDIIWLMPIYPIGQKNRKGKLGSPYSVKDYKGLNPEFGNESDFRLLVDDIHKLGMYIILDWVPNHSSFDNNWTKTNPEWYTKDSLGQITYPAGTDWTDVADLDYSNQELRDAMTDAMLYWIKKYDIDGYRCDVAGWVPNDFWKSNNAKLQSVKHVFMLAEWDDPKLHEAGFHMTYGWGFHHLMNQIAQRKRTAASIDTFMRNESKRYKPQDYRLNFITNHDENSWNGTIEERMGKAGDALAVLAFTIQGMPLIYGGQEANLSKRLKFFEKDTISWMDTSKVLFYKKLLTLKHTNKALANGIKGGKVVSLSTKAKTKSMYVYYRQVGQDIVVVALNLGDTEVTTTIDTPFNSKLFLILSDGNDLKKYLDESKWSFPPWGYKIWSTKQI